MGDHQRLFVLRWFFRLRVRRGSIYLGVFLRRITFRLWRRHVRLFLPYLLHWHYEVGFSQPLTIIKRSLYLGMVTEQRGWNWDTISQWNTRTTIYPRECGDTRCGQYSRHRHNLKLAEFFVSFAWKSESTQDSRLTVYSQWLTFQLGDIPGRWEIDTRRCKGLQKRSLNGWCLFIQINYILRVWLQWSSRSIYHFTHWILLTGTFSESIIPRILTKWANQCGKPGKKIGNVHSWS